MPDNTPKPGDDAGLRREGANSINVASVARQGHGELAATDDAPADHESLSSRLIIRIVTINLWLSVSIGAAVAITLIILPYKHIITGLPGYIAAQVGSGLLVVAVGAGVLRFITAGVQSLD